jgi:hypothetical protein
MRTLSADVTHPLRWWAENQQAAKQVQKQHRRAHGDRLSRAPAGQAILKRNFSCGKLAPGAVAVNFDDGPVCLPVPRQCSICSQTLVSGMPCLTYKKPNARAGTFALCRPHRFDAGLRRGNVVVQTNQAHSAAEASSSSHMMQVPPEMLADDAR